MDSQELCALCYEKTAEDSVITQCCSEPICQDCLTSSQNYWDLSPIICGNCGATTALSAKTFPQVVKIRLSQLTTDCSSVLGHTQAKLEKITNQRDQFDTLLQQLQANMTALLGQSDQSDTTQPERDQINRAVRQHGQIYSKSLALLKADHHQVERQIAARVKYLRKMAGRLNHLKTRSNQVDLAALTELVQLEYDLDSLAEITIPTIPDYQPVRWFNHRLALDDVKDQFRQAVERKFRYRTTHAGIISRLEQDFNLTGARPSFLVEAPEVEGSGEKSSNEAVESAVEVLGVIGCPTGQPVTHLTCYTSWGTDAFTLVDQSGQVVYYRPNIILTATKEWLIELVPEVNLHQSYQPETGCLKITPLRDLLNQPEDCRLNKAADVVESLYIPLNCRFGEWPSLGFYQDDLVVIYKQSHDSTWLCQRWRLANVPVVDPRLITEFHLPPQRRILYLNNNTVIVAIDQINGPTRYYCESLSNVLKSGTVALTQPLEGGRDKWFDFKDGSTLMVNDHYTGLTGQLWRPDPVGFNLALTTIHLTTIPCQLNQYNTTPWDGRLYRMMVESNDNYYDQNDNLQRPWNVVIEFY